MRKGAFALRVLHFKKAASFAANNLRRGRVQYIRTYKYGFCDEHRTALEEVLLRYMLQY